GNATLTNIATGPTTLVGVTTGSGSGSTLNITESGPVTISTTGLANTTTMSVTANGGSAPNPTSKVSSGTLQVTANGPINTTGTISSACGSCGALSLSTTPGSNGSITLGNVTVPVVTLNAGGSGSISQTNGTTLDLKGTLTVITGSGNA